MISTGVINLGGGLPSSQYFPFERLDVKVARAPHFSEQDTLDSGVVKSIGKHDAAEGKGNYGLSLRFLDQRLICHWRKTPSQRETLQVDSLTKESLALPSQSGLKGSLPCDQALTR